MKPIIPLILAALAASACATSPTSPLPVCDGKHPRPANPHGSMLDPSAPASLAAPAASPASADTGGCGA